MSHATQFWGWVGEVLQKPLVEEPYFSATHYDSTGVFYKQEGEVVMFWWKSSQKWVVTTFRHKLNDKNRFTPL